MPDVILKNVPGMAAATPVPVLQANALSEREFKGAYVANSRPCLIKGAVSHWPAIRKWHDREYLKRICGSRPGRCLLFWPHENHVTRKNGSRPASPACLSRGSNRPPAGCGARRRVAAIGCNSGNAEMAADLSGFSFFTEAELGFSYPPFRFFVFRKAGSSWHYHPMDETLMCQVVGTKRVGLLKVESPHRQAVGRIFFKEDYYENPSAFDELAGESLPWFVADLDEGDALYIPPLWWHGVVVTSDGIGVTAPVSWRSPVHVIAETLRKMAAGDLDLTTASTVASIQFRQLLDAARKLADVGTRTGNRILEARRRQTKRQVSLMDQFGARDRPPKFQPGRRPDRQKSANWPVSCASTSAADCCARHPGECGGPIPFWGPRLPRSGSAHKAGCAGTRPESGSR